MKLETVSLQSLLSLPPSHPIDEKTKSTCQIIYKDLLYRTSTNPSNKAEYMCSHNYESQADQAFRLPNISLASSS